ncbi:hypothetical protein KRX54_02165, partial [Actinomycetaceae bacterium TAE3-ERU4]|nr:hypothetical protein [Actinomycetaceae bacterium TAE3-ERU4]
RTSNRFVSLAGVTADLSREDLKGIKDMPVFNKSDLETIIRVTGSTPQGLLALHNALTNYRGAHVGALVSKYSNKEEAQLAVEKYLSNDAYLEGSFIKSISQASLGHSYDEYQALKIWIELSKTIERIPAILDSDLPENLSAQDLQNGKTQLANIIQKTKTQNKNPDELTTQTLMYRQLDITRELYKNKIINLEDIHYCAKLNGQERNLNNWFSAGKFPSKIQIEHDENLKLILVDAGKDSYDTVVYLNRISKRLSEESLLSYSK